jgi:hypothetical protein
MGVEVGKTIMVGAGMGVGVKEGSPTSPEVCERTVSSLLMFLSNKPIPKYPTKKQIGIMKNAEAITFFIRDCPF